MFLRFLKAEANRHIKDLQVTYIAINWVRTIKNLHHPTSKEPKADTQPSCMASLATVLFAIGIFSQSIFPQLQLARAVCVCVCVKVCRSRSWAGLEIGCSFYGWVEEGGRKLFRKKPLRIFAADWTDWANGSCFVCYGLFVCVSASISYLHIHWISWHVW